MSPAKFSDFFACGAKSSKVRSEAAAATKTRRPRTSMSVEHREHADFWLVIGRELCAQGIGSVDGRSGSGPGTRRGGRDRKREERAEQT